MAIRLGSRNHAVRYSGVFVTSTSKFSPAKNAGRTFRVGLAAALLLGCSPLALHAETSNAELAKEIAELKAQIKSLRGSVAETRTEVKKTKVRTVVAPAPAPVPSAFASLPEGATPVFATADKKLQFGALTITPGGFIEMAGLFRSRANNSDISSNYNNDPFNNVASAHIPETKLTLRASRFAVLIEAPVSKDLLVSGYGEFDLQGGGTTSNNNQTFGYVPRVRNLYAQLDSADYGFHVLAGQNWSLITLNSKGITPRNEVLPPGLDGGVLPGYSYGRTPQIRIVKDFNKKLWLALDAEAAGSSINNGSCTNIVSNTTAAPTAAITPNTATGVASGNCLVAGSGNYGQQGETQQLSFNKVPDVLAKVAYEARVFDRDIHLEATGIYRNFVDNVNYGSGAFATPGASTFAAVPGYYANSNQSTNGYGIGAGIIAPLIPTKLDAQLSGDIGRGIGKFTSTGLPDATITGNGGLKPIGVASVNGGLILHASPSFDVYGFAGVDQMNREFSVGSGGAQIGYGQTGGVNNYGCEVEGGTCAGVTHRVYAFQAGFIDKLYKGAYGEVRVSAEYEYVVRQLFAATTNANGIATAAAPMVGPRNNDQMVFTSLRYFPFQ